jgi:hypothetical protein
MNFLKLILFALTMCACNPALAVEAGAAGQVLRVPSTGGKAKMGPLDLSSSNATSNNLSYTKINGFTSGACLFGGGSGNWFQETTANCFYDATNHGLALGAASLPSTALLDLESTTRGFLAPRMTTTQKNAISSPATGLLVYDTVLLGYSFYNGSVWINLNSVLNNPMTTGGDVIYGGASGVPARLANGSSGQVLTSAGGTSAPTWVYPTPNYTSQTTTYAAAINDYVKASGSSFAITLPTAVGNGGRWIWVEHDGTSLTAQYTINTTSGQTININGTAVASGGFVFQTQGEKALFLSNNATWEMAEHYTYTQPQSWTLMLPSKFTITSGNATAGAVYTNNSQTFVVIQTVSASVSVQMVGTGNPAASGTLTKTSGTGDATLTFSAFANSFGTVSGVTAFWTRYSNRMKAWGFFTPGTATANLAAFNLPGAAASPVVMDTTQLSPSANVITNPGMKVGVLQCSGSASALYNFVTAPGTNSSMLFDANVLSGTTTLTPQASQGGITSGSPCSFDFDIAINGWQP